MASSSALLALACLALFCCAGASAAYTPAELDARGFNETLPRGPSGFARCVNHPTAERKAAMEADLQARIGAWRRGAGGAG